MTKIWQVCDLDYLKSLSDSVEAEVKEAGVQPLLTDVPMKLHLITHDQLIVVKNVLAWALEQAKGDKP